MPDIDRTSGWEKTTVGEISTLIRGITYGKEHSSKSPRPGLKPILRANNINGTLNFDDLIYVPEDLISAQQIIKSGDIIFAMSSGSKHLVGKSARARSDFDGSYGAFCGLLRPADGLDKAFLYYVFQNNKFRRLISEVAKGSNINNLKREHITDFEISLPPIAEQHRIVAKIEELFSELDKGIESLKTAQQQLKVYRQALLKHAFEGKLTAQWRADNADKLETAEALLTRIKQEREQRYQQQLAEWEAAGKPGSKPKAPKPLAPLTAAELSALPGLPEGWGWVRLGELTWSVKDGPHFSPKYADEGIPFISGGNIRPDGVDFTTAKFISRELHEELSRRCKPAVGDLLYTKGGTTGIARVNTYDVDFNVWVHVAVLKLTSAVRPFYLQHALNSSFCYAQSQKLTHGVGNQDLGLTRMVNIVLAICSLGEQEQIISVVDDRMSVIDQLDKAIADSLQQSAALRQAILKKAFSGQLVPQDPGDEPASALLARIKAECVAAAKPRKASTGDKSSTAEKHLRP